MFFGRWVNLIEVTAKFILAGSTMSLKKIQRKNSKQMKPQTAYLKIILQNLSINKNQSKRNTHRKQPAKA